MSSNGQIALEARVNQSFYIRRKGEEFFQSLYHVQPIKS
jgi:hypothetical protein